MDKTKLFFEVDASQIDIKPILRKEFLELSMKAISSANPNRNNSWFTPESMEKSKHTFVNKPILGYFENGDFVSHNGDWNYDSETEMDYWDTLGKKGERILGVIRESDEIKVIQDKNGLSWICLTCMLWTQYSYKQVKRLLKDAKQAAKKGGPTKNISVEVDITDWERLDNGVMKINEFNLVGITILGSRNGVKVEPGIEDAELSVVDIMGRDTYEKQQQALRLAYERLDDSDNTQSKEEFSQMEIKQENIEVVSEEAAVAAKIEETTVENSDGNEGTVNFESTTEEQVPASEEIVVEESTVITEEVSSSEEQHENFEDGNICAETETPAEDIQPVAENVEVVDHSEETPSETSCEEVHENESCGKECCEEKRDVICDLAWLISDCHWNIESINHSIEYYQNSEEEYKEYILSVLNRILLAQKEYQKDLGELLGKIAAGVSEDDRNYEAKLAQYSNIYELINNYESSLNTNKELSEKLSNYEHKEFMEQANALIASAKLEEEVSAKFQKDCEEGAINSIADLKIKVAVAAFDSNVKIEETNTLTVPVSAPDTVAAFSSKAEKSSKKADAWSSLHEYIGK